MKIAIIPWAKKNYSESEMRATEGRIKRTDWQCEGLRRNARSPPGEGTANFETENDV
jgi:hypothetical protein